MSRASLSHVTSYGRVPRPLAMSSGRLSFTSRLHLARPSERQTDVQSMREMLSYHPAILFVHGDHSTTRKWLILKTIIGCNPPVKLGPGGMLLRPMFDKRSASKGKYASRHRNHVVALWTRGSQSFLCAFFCGGSRCQATALCGNYATTTRRPVAFARRWDRWARADERLRSETKRCARFIACFAAAQRTGRSALRAPDHVRTVANR